MILSFNFNLSARVFVFPFILLRDSLQYLAHTSVYGSKSERMKLAAVSGTISEKKLAYNINKAEVA